jgi:5-formyltetrahydrofolate cyclo-ligase
MIKSDLRKIFLARQRSLSPGEREEKSRDIADRFIQSDGLADARVLHCFVAIRKFNEIDTSFIFRRVWAEFPAIKTVVPRVIFETGEMENLTFGPETELVANAWEIHEPVHDEYVDTNEIDIVLVPGLCFDRAGHRVGYGKGFYDRFLSRCRPDCLKIGLSYFDPVPVIADAGEHDVRLDRLVTPHDTCIFEHENA